ncbi:hypothetical protein ABZV67_07805 [Streptomyces sp. NPDC005065]|uniref:hypothetical protein n=1 Tax=unclassified Streptomyces TaxID=2593676 RepID=UPI0033AD98AC
MGEAFARQAGGKRWIRYSYDALAELAAPTARSTASGTADLQKLLEQQQGSAAGAS